MTWQDFQYINSAISSVQRFGKLALPQRPPQSECSAVDPELQLLPKKSEIPFHSPNSETPHKIHMNSQSDLHGSHRVWLGNMHKPSHQFCWSTCQARCSLPCNAPSNSLFDVRCLCIALGNILQYLPRRSFVQMQNGSGTCLKRN